MYAAFTVQSSRTSHKIILVHLTDSAVLAIDSCSLHWLSVASCSTGCDLNVSPIHTSHVIATHPMDDTIGTQVLVQIGLNQYHQRSEASLSHMSVQWPSPLTSLTYAVSRIFSKRKRIRYVCYMLSQIRLSSICNVGAPYSAGWNFRQFFHHTLAQGL